VITDTNNADMAADMAADTAADTTAAIEKASIPDREKTKDTVA